MSELLTKVELNSATIEFWEDNVRTVFKDSKCVTAAPNEGESMLDTAIHEVLHSIVAEALHNGPSECLRGVAEGNGRQWTPGKVYEEGLAYSMTPSIKKLFEALQEAYAR